jgi:hypothetical protein
MIGRADIEGSKSGVAMDAWPPRASSRYRALSAIDGASLPASQSACLPGGPLSGYASPAYPAVVGLSGGTLSGGGRLYLKPAAAQRAAAHTLPVVETPYPRCHTRPAAVLTRTAWVLEEIGRLLIDPIRQVVTMLQTHFSLPSPMRGRGAWYCRLDGCSQQPGVSPL